MNALLKYGLFTYTCIVLCQACGNQPKVISAETPESTVAESSGIFSDDRPPLVASEGSNTANTQDVHTVVVEEVLPTSKYVYLFVKEGEESFWIATAKQEVAVGGTYFYKGGLLKTNFESKEHNRIFDKMYLVSRVVPVNHGGAENALSGGTTQTTAKDNAAEDRTVNREGSIKIADLVANPAKYEGKIIQVSGECVKINPNIMGKNWIHLKDGSQDDYDLVLTSQIGIPEGHVVTMEGLVVLNKDFGAGYRYDIILEDCTVIR